MYIDLDLVFTLNNISRKSGIDPGFMSIRFIQFGGPHLEKIMQNY